MNMEVEGMPTHVQTHIHRNSRNEFADEKKQFGHIRRFMRTPIDTPQVSIKFVEKRKEKTKGWLRIQKQTQNIQRAQHR